MQLWQRLYNTVWLAFLACVLIPRWMGKYAGPPVHVLLGLAMLALTVLNARRLAALPVPARLQRISKVTAGIAAFQVVGGLAFGAVTHVAPNLPVVGSVLHGVHVVCALAMLAQASSVATGYDMWEEKELAPATSKPAVSPEPQDPSDPVAGRGGETP
jgi:hypothetical protein